MNEGRAIVSSIVLCGLLAACGGGSGSTGLITPEQALINDVQATGTCGTFDGAPYCATDSPDAVAPGGQRANVLTPVPTPQVSATPGGAVPTSTPAAGGATPTAPGDLPTPSATATPITRTVTVAVEGFEAGAACATGARPAESDETWRTGTLIAVDDSGTPVVFPLPAGITEPFELALLCFDDPPAALASELDTLADAEPTVVFVLPDF
jgi:hypothetical protein